MSQYTEMEYADVQSLAKERELNAKGSKEELVARLVEADSTPAVPDPVVPTAETPAAPAATTEKEVQAALLTDVARMKAHLASQPKVKIMIPLEQGMSVETAAKVPFTVNINGYRLSIKRGVFVEVPEQVAEIVMRRLESEGKIGSEYEINQSQQKVEALG